LGEAEGLGIAELDAVFATRTPARSGEAFEVTEGPRAVMQTPRELHGDPHVAANEYLKEVAGGSRGRFALVATPVQFGARHSLRYGAY
jgi:crotonobetainyl-CoA:carnitine CoA-transferase CaiB-like acyl-CoA transferase